MTIEDDMQIPSGRRKKIAVVLALLIVCSQLNGAAFGGENWLLDQRRCIAFRQNTSGQIVRLTTMNDLLLLDSSEADMKSSFGRDESLLLEIDTQAARELHSAADMRMEGWYIVGAAIPSLKILASGRSLVVSKADKSHAVSINVDGMRRVEDFLKRCHL